MIRLDALNISLDTGVIPPLNKIDSKILNFGITVDYGVIPPKNYFRSGINVLGINGYLLGDSEKFGILYYQIL